MQKRIKSFPTSRLVKSEDLNHHKTLYAGRSAEWFVESGFVAAASLLNPANIICAQIHGMAFKRPVNPGQIVCYTSRIVYAGKSSIYGYVSVSVDDDISNVQVEGFITFVHVDDENHPQPHGIEIIAETEEEKQLQQRAIQLKQRLDESRK